MKVLLTGDDGYQALGLRIVATILKEQGFDVKIAATQGQRSSTGGSFPGKGTWGKDTVEGIEALWVDGMPADSVEVAHYAYGDTFDLVVSGMNMGTNVGSVPASGTMGAARHALEKGTAPKALAFSWRVPETLWDKAAETLVVADYASYPKATVSKLIALALENNLWQADFLNFNLPATPPSTLRICAPAFQTYKQYYAYTMNIDSENHTYQKVGNEPHQLSGHLEYDAFALSQGYATVVPWLSNQYVNQELLQLVGTEITL